MSDRDLTCKNCGKEIEGLGWVHVDTQYGRCDIPSAGGGLQYAEPTSAAPVEPPVLSREFLDSLIEALPLPYRADPPTAKWAKEGAKLLATAILESLSQEDGNV